MARLYGRARRGARVVGAVPHGLLEDHDRRGWLLDAFSPTECAHYLAHAGYVPSNREPL
jgi:hypothetical protein